MAQAGVGVDMFEIARMEKAMRRTPGLVGRVFTSGERRWCDRAARPARRYAGCIAARGAVLRALGVGPRDGAGRWDVSVGRDATGRPLAVLGGRAAEAAQEQGVREVALSLSFTHEVAVANAVAVTDAVRPQAKAQDDSQAALRASFREMRSVIDELERVENQQDTTPGQGAIGE